LGQIRRKLARKPLKRPRARFPVDTNKLTTALNRFAAIDSTRVGLRWSSRGLALTLSSPQGEGTDTIAGETVTEGAACVSPWRLTDALTALGAKQVRLSCSDRSPLRISPVDNANVSAALCQISNPRLDGKRVFGPGELNPNGEGAAF
jgi:hypothetical protein